MSGPQNWRAHRLVAENLSVARGGLAVLEGIDLNLASGAALVLRGANGIGKTSLLRTLAGLQPPLVGVLRLPPEDLTYAGHADGLKSVLSVQENLSFWAQVAGQTGTGRAMTAMDLTTLAHRRAADLSAGQKRRLGLARLLVTGRWLWLLDEPTVSLDTASAALFVSVLRAHLGQGGSAVIASHIDLGLPEAEMMDLTRYRALHDAPTRGGFDEAFT